MNTPLGAIRTFILAASIWGASGAAQPLAYSVSTIAGGSTSFDFADGKSATSFLIPSFSTPAVDVQGNFYFSLGHRVVQVGANGQAKTFAGTGVAGFSGDGAAAAKAQLNSPSVVLFDAQGRLIIMDSGNFRIRRVELNGNIFTIAGTGQIPPVSMDGESGPAISARIRPFLGMATLDSSQNLYFVDNPANFASSIRRIDVNGRITTLSQNVGVYPNGLASDGTNVYLADSNPAVNRVSKMLPTGGQLVAVTGNRIGFAGDGAVAINASFTYPQGIAIDGMGNLYIADNGNQRIRIARNTTAGAVASGQGIVNTVAGNGILDFGADGAPALASPLASPAGIALDASGNIYFSDIGTGRYRKFTLAGSIQTVAGLPTTDPLGDGGPALQADLSGPANIFRDSAGNLLIIDGTRLRQVSADGTISRIAGRGIPGTTGDNGPALQATLNTPYGVVKDGAGNVFVLDNNVLRRIGLDGTITRISGFPGATLDAGPAAQVNLGVGESLAIDAQDNIYIGSFMALRKMTPSGMITRVAGSPMFNAPAATGGNALTANVNTIFGVVADQAGNVYFNDTIHSRVLKVNTAGVFTTVAGALSKPGFSGDGGPAAQALLNYPAALTIDPWGNLYVADIFNNNVRKIGQDGNISTVAGSVTGPVSAPAPIADGSTALSGPLVLSVTTGLFADPAGNLFIIEGRTVRQLTPDKLRASGIVHAATKAATQAVAGLRILIGGTELIPPGAVSSDIQVLFDGQPAAFVSNDGGQITTVVPMGVAGQTSTALQVIIRGASTNALSLPVAAALPGILGILNVDGSLNGNGSPASSSDAITLQVTGDGGADPSTFMVFIGGTAANILATAPQDSTSGILLVTVQIPDGTADGSPVVFSVAGVNSQDGVALRLQ